MIQVDNKKIAKNTLYMYLRMLVTLAVSLFTTRIVFRALGVDNYGVYNVVGSIIVFFTFINTGLTTASRRYITAELTQGDEESQRNIFNLAVWAHILISVIILVLAETIGLWAVNHLLNIPEGRMFAANIVYQLSVLSAVLSVMQAPFSAAITANERMNIYAYLSIFDVLLKLVVAYIVMIANGDKLIIYAICIFVVGFINIVVNRIYCYRNFPMCKYKRPHNKALLKELFGYMGWNMVGQGMVVLSNQGVTILINNFFTVAANAAMGVSNQITHIVQGFATNFQVAFNPQIIKLYVAKEYAELKKLAFRCCRISCYLVLIFLVPICFQINNFLALWLGDYPEYTVEFSVLTLVSIFIDASAAPLWMILSADKNIKKYQIVISIIYSMTFWGAWIALKLGFAPYSVIIVRILMLMTGIVARLILIKEKINNFSLWEWVIEVPVKSLLVVLIPIAFCFIIRFISFESLLVELFVKSGLSFAVACLSVLFVGLTKGERKLVLNKIPIIKNTRLSDL